MNLVSSRRARGHRPRRADRGRPHAVHGAVAGSSMSEPAIHLVLCLDKDGERVAAGADGLRRRDQRRVSRTGACSDEVTLVHRGLVPASPGHSDEPQLRAVPRHSRSRGRRNARGGLGSSGEIHDGRRVAEQADRLRRVEDRTPRRALPHGSGPAAGRGDRRLRGHPARIDARCANPPGRGHTEAPHRHIRQPIGVESPISPPIAPEWAAPLSAGTPAIRAEVIHAVRAEMACTLSDAVLRRTTLGSAGYPGDEIAAVVRRPYGR